jgi:hypothetical protein
VSRRKALSLGELPDVTESNGHLIIHLLLLWVAVFVGLDLAFGEGALTEDAGLALERALQRLRDLLRSLVS